MTGEDDMYMCKRRIISYLQMNNEGGRGNQKTKDENITNAAKKKKATVYTQTNERTRQTQYLESARRPDCFFSLTNTRAELYENEGG